MEKFEKRTGEHFGVGLLTLVFILFSPMLFAQNSRRFTTEDVAKLFVEPTEEVVFTENEAHFRLQIHGVASSNIQMELPDFPEGVLFNSSRSEEFISVKDDWLSWNSNERGTQYDFFFTFKKAGKITLPSIVLYIDGRKYFVKFKEIYVYENLQTIIPRALIEFENGVTIFSDEKNSQKLFFEVGTPVKFTIYLQYGIQLQQFAWSIPKNSIFKELKRYDVVSELKENSEKGKTRFSAERIPVADFEWIPLEKGRFTLPDIRLVATAYSERSFMILMPECVVDIIPEKENVLPQQESGTAEDSIFAYAFTQEENIATSVEKNTVDIFELAGIADLRSTERHSFLQNKIRAQRRAAEEKIGIQNSQCEPSVPFFILLASIYVAFAIAALVLHFTRKKMLAAFCTVISLVFLFFTVLLSHRIFERCAIVIGGSISPVPEYSALTKTAAGQGGRVVVLEEIKDWYYIEYNEIGGWIKKENLVLIK